MRNDLDCLAQIGALALLRDDGIVDLAGRYVVGLGRMDTQESFVMAQVQVGLGAVFRDVALTVLIRIERTGIDVDVGIEFLDGDAKAARLQEFGQGSRDDAFPKRRSHSARYEYILGVHGSRRLITGFKSKNNLGILRKKLLLHDKSRLFCKKRLRTSGGICVFRFFNFSKNYINNREKSGFYTIIY